MVIHEGASALSEATAVPEITAMSEPDENAPYMRALRTYETVINLISNTTNHGGLVVRARLDRRNYPIGKTVSAKELRELNIERDEFHGDWNYVIKPRKDPATS